MKVLGLVTEYNPFHNGHLYHLEKSKELTKCDYSVCVMSGNFIQRGEPAIIDKWQRAKMAIKNGVDLVLELPVLYSMQSAEQFAFGSIRILDALGVVDSICFGSEAGNLNILDGISSVLNEEPEEFKLHLKASLNEGLSFAQARCRALIKYFEDKNVDHDNLSKILNSSNNILGIEYLKALKKLDSKIVPYTIQRVKNEYNATEITDNIASATSIRLKLNQTQTLDDIKPTIPRTTLDILSGNFSNGKGPVYSSNFDNLIISSIRKMTTKEIAETFDVEEGLENRIKKAAMKVATLTELINAVKTKRYTQTRIQRILFHILLGIKKDIYNKLSENGGPQYIRILAFNEKGKEILANARKKAILPIIMKISNYTSSDELSNKMLDYDLLSTNIYTLAYQNPEFKVGDLDYTHGVIIEK